jgi:riboflavin kinase/FMN adenylyltransferase
MRRAMSVVLGSASFPASLRGGAATLGNFDGVHRGHVAVLDALRAAAREVGGPSVVYTFDPAPTAVLVPERHPPRLLSLEARVAELHAAGVDVVVVERFSRALAAHPARWFAEQVVGRRLGARAVVLGWDARFGRGREGSAESLREHLPGVLVRELPALTADGTPVSSSRVRALVAEGDVTNAAALLGRPHRLHGTVVHGDARGRTIGFPTANLLLDTELLPAHGVYAVRARADGIEGTFPGVMNLGVRPTVDGSRLSVEVHLLGWSGDLYGAGMTVDLVQRVREERRFPSLDALVAQIRADAAAAARILGGA